MNETPLWFFQPGNIVTWNEAGARLFGQTTATALVIDIRLAPANVAHLMWSTGQETWASLDCLQRVDGKTPIELS